MSESSIPVLAILAGPLQDRETLFWFLCRRYKASKKRRNSKNSRNAAEINLKQIFFPRKSTELRIQLVMLISRSKHLPHHPLVPRVGCPKIRRILMTVNIKLNPIKSFYYIHLNSININLFCIPERTIQLIFQFSRHVTLPSRYRIYFSIPDCSPFLIVHHSLPFPTVPHRFLTGFLPFFSPFNLF